MKFQRQNVSQKKRVKTGWRKPRGIDNKQRISKKGFGALPKVGYRCSYKERSKHPCGLVEALVSNEKELLAAKGKAVRFSSKLGKRRYDELKKKAEELKMKVLN